MVGVAKTDQLGSIERIQEKIEKIKQFARAAPAVSCGDGAEVEGLRDALRIVQIRERELNRRIQVLDNNNNGNLAKALHPYLTIQSWWHRKMFQ